MTDHGRCVRPYRDPSGTPYCNASADTTTSAATTTTTASATTTAAATTG